MESSEVKISIVGLGYVGLPLAVKSGKKYTFLGFDINNHRIKELKIGYDRTKEIESDNLKKCKFLNFNSDKNDLKDSNVFIATMPTPIGQFKTPDLTPLLQA